MDALIPTSTQIKRTCHTAFLMQYHTVFVVIVDRLLFVLFTCATVQVVHFFKYLMLQNTIKTEIL